MFTAGILVCIHGPKDGIALGLFTRREAMLRRVLGFTLKRLYGAF